MSNRKVDEIPAQTASLSCCHAAGHLFVDGTEAQGSMGELATRAASILDRSCLGWRMLRW